MAKRALGLLNEDCKLERGFTSFSIANEAVGRAINAYTTLRPHISLNYLTSKQLHQRSESSSSFAGSRLEKYGTGKWAFRGSNPMSLVTVQL